MRLAGSITAGICCSLVLVGAAVGCGGGGNSAGDSVVQLPTVTAPQAGPPTKSQNAQNNDATMPSEAQTPPAAPSSTGPSAATQGSRGGASKQAKQTKAERRRQKNCEKQVAGLPEEQQRRALNDCLDTTQPAPATPGTAGGGR